MTQGYVIVIQPDGLKTEMTVSKAPNLAESQKLVGGYIELVPGWTQWYMKDHGLVPAIAICDEEGKLTGKKMNHEATRLWHAISPGSKEFIDEWSDGDSD